MIYVYGCIIIFGNVCAYTPDIVIVFDVSELKFKYFPKVFDIFKYFHQILFSKTLSVATVLFQDHM